MPRCGSLGPSGPLAAERRVRWAASSGAVAMRILTTGECVQWCRERDYPTYESPGLSVPRASERPEGFHPVPFVIPPDSGRRVWLARLLVSSLEPYPEILLWIGDWSVWPSSEHMPLFTRLRAAIGETRPLIEAPGHAINPADSDDAVSLLAICMFFSWGAHLIHGSGRDAIEVDHHDEGWFASRDPAVAKAMATRLESVAEPDAAQQGVEPDVE
jgi:hypothetical protein